VEAVLDLDCDMPPNFDLAALEQAGRDAFRETYPHFHFRFLEQHQIKAGVAEPTVHIGTRDLNAHQFLKEDLKQLVQVRRQGFSFNRLAPYSSLDDYIDEVHRTWQLFVKLTSPVQVITVRLRYINRIMLPLSSEGLPFDDYLKGVPQTPNESNLAFNGFFYQYTGVEAQTGNNATITVTTQPPEIDKLPLIFDIGVSHNQPLMVDDWKGMLEKILSLRGLKNRIFGNTLTEKCLELFQN
jgi:uncharacterized protein (TIGR04255 family)